MSRDANESVRWLRWVLLSLVVAGAAALPFTVVPAGWLAAIHRAVGLGDMPDGPVFLYLARTLSAFYALTGGLIAIVYRDLRRYGPIVWYIGGAMVVLGVFVLLLDLLLGLPWWWTVGEGVGTVVYGGLILGLVRAARGESPPAELS